MRFLPLLLLILSLGWAQSVISPVFPYKDGSASYSEYNGSSKQIIIDGSIDQSVGWITFVTDGIDFLDISSAKLMLYVRTLVTPGILKVNLLREPVSAPESNVSLSSLNYYQDHIGSVYLGFSDVEKFIQFDITDSLRYGKFFGIVLHSDDGLIATLDAKEGSSKPMILLTTRIVSRSSKWLNGNSTPHPDSGLPGDYYLNIYNGNVYYKKYGGWMFSMSMMGPQGPAGTTGPRGIQGERGYKGDIGERGVDGRSFIWRGAWSSTINYCENDVITYSGIAYVAKKSSLNVLPSDATFWDVMVMNGQRGSSPVSYSTDTMTIKSVGDTVSLKFGDNRDAFFTGQQVRVVSKTSLHEFIDGQIYYYSQSDGQAKIFINYSQGYGKKDDKWAVVASGVPASTSWYNEENGMKTYSSVGIGTSPLATNAISVQGNIAIVNNGILKFSDGTEQATAYDPQTVPAMKQFNEMQDTINSLKARLSAIENLLKNITRDDNNLYVTGVNLWLKNGSGSTDIVNNTGNLIIGYNESTDPANYQNGSHNIILGKENSYSSFGSIISGSNNKVNSPYGSIIGGKYNIVEGEYGVVIGGQSNKSTGIAASVTGGQSNIASGECSSISGGQFDSANGYSASISGGSNNVAYGNAASISGGSYNYANGNYASVSGGSANKSNGFNTSISGGTNNTSTGNFSTVAGGEYDTASGIASTVTGGKNNNAGGDNSSISAGINNRAMGYGASVTGGSNNKALYVVATVSGGIYNVANGTAATIAGGLMNEAIDSCASSFGGGKNVSAGKFSTTAGGENDSAKGRYSSVNGGFENVSTGQYSVVNGGINNSAGGTATAISGGYYNSTDGNASVVSGGRTNSSTADGSTVGGGENNAASVPNSWIVGPYSAP